MPMTTTTLTSALNQQYYLCTASTSTTFVVSSGWSVRQEYSVVTDWADQATMVNEDQHEIVARARQSLDRARILLSSMLDDHQRAMYEVGRSFEVFTTRTGQRRRYLVEEGWAGNIFRLDDLGDKIEKYCIHSVKEIPLPDNMLAQKLLLETDEETFLKTANRSVRGRSGNWVPTERAA